MLAHNHLGGAVLAQVLDFDLGMGAGDDRQRVVELPRLRYHLAAFERIRDGNEQATRGRQVRCPDHLWMGGIAEDRLPPLALERRDPVAASITSNGICGGSAALMKPPTRP